MDNELSKLLKNSFIPDPKERDLARLIDAIHAGPAPHVAPSVKLDCGLIVSTILSHDCGHETGIRDINDEVRIVERYPDEEAAIEGHARWVEKAETLTRVLDVGYGESVPPTEFDLARNDE